MVANHTVIHFGRSPIDESDYKKTMGKVAVVYLNTPVDFDAWHIALRRLVKGLNMGDALMFSVPRDQIPSFEARIKKVAVKIKVAETEKAAL